MKYIIVLQTKHDGDAWRLWRNGNHDTSEAALQEMRKQKREMPDAKFEMHPVDDHAWSAMRREVEIYQMALHKERTS